MHKDWCGKSCCNCTKPCKLDESIPCSPDCEHLGANGEHTSPECQGCDALMYEKSDGTWDVDEAEEVSE